MPLGIIIVGLFRAASSNRVVAPALATTISAAAKTIAIFSLINGSSRQPFIGLVLEAISS